MKRLVIAFVIFLVPSMVWGHDTWVEVNTPVIRVDDVIHIDLKLGNHGNDHRDFKLASKIGLSSCTLNVLDATGESRDIKDCLVDLGFTPKEGYWSGRFLPAKPGLHLVGHTGDALHGKTKSIKSAKTYFLATIDGEVTTESSVRNDKPLGHTLEIVPLTHPVLDCGPDLPVRIKVLFEGKPLSKGRVTFIPRGQVLAEGMDPAFERLTDSEGTAEFTPRDGNVILIVVHHLLQDRSGEGFDKTQYSATLTMAVPQRPFRTKSITPVSDRQRP